MKKWLSVFVTAIMVLVCISGFSACSNSQNSEISIKYIDNKLYARFNSGIPGMSASSSHMSYDNPISFEEYEKGSEVCISRSNCYVRFMITFNYTPKDYKAIDVYELNYFTLDTSFNPERYMVRREGKNAKEIEVLIYLQNYTFSETKHMIKSLTYTMFDSTVGEKVQKTFELNYKFTTEPIPNFFNRFEKDSSFDAHEIDCSRNRIEFSVESNIDYDKILYNVDQKGGYFESSEWEAIVKEATMAKSETYIYEIDTYNSYLNGDREFTIVGYQKNNINYYTYPISFVMRNK